MKLRTQSLRYGLAVILASLTAGALAGQETDNQYSVQPVYDNNSKVRFSSLEVVETDAGVFLKGRITRSSSSMSVPPGHVDILVSNTNGEVLLDTSARYSPSKLHRKSHSSGQRGSHFTVQLPDSLPKEADIRVSYHQKTIDKSKSSPSGLHQKNSLI